MAQINKLFFTKKQKTYISSHYGKETIEQLAIKVGCSYGGMRSYLINAGIHRVIPHAEQVRNAKHAPKAEEKKWVKRAIQCKCPKCEKLYMRKINNWVGNTPAKLFCRVCREYADANPVLSELAVII